MERRWSSLLAAATLVVAAAACANDDTTDTTATGADGGSGRIPLVVDTDLASDDIVALMYLSAHPDVDLLAVTVTGAGEVHCPRGADIARGLLQAIDRGDVPVACGSSEPLSGDRAFPDEWRQFADNAYGLILPVVAEPDGAPSAVELLTTTLMASEEPVVLLTLGPLTNVAEALQADVSLADRLGSVVVMGGALDVDGNVYLEPEDRMHPAEWNLYVDPAAASAVVSSGAPVTLVPLDATNQVPVDQEFVDLLAANDRTIESGYVVDLFAGGARAPEYLWDPLAAATATDPDLMTISDALVSVVVDGDEAGRTVRDGDGDPVVLALPIDPAVVLHHLVRVLAGVPDDEELVTPTTLPLVGEATLAFDGAACTYDGPTELQVGRLEVTLDVADVDFAGGVAHLIAGSDPAAVIEWANANPGQQPPEVDAIDLVTTDDQPSVITARLQAGTSTVVCFDPSGRVYLGANLTVSG